MKTTITKVAAIMTFVLTSVFSYSQITTTAPTIDVCPGTATVAVPITVTSFSGVASISLTLNYNVTVLGYVNSTNNPALAGGFLVVNAANGQVKAAWFGLAPVTLADNAVLFTFNFNYLGGSCPLVWDLVTQGNCQYSDLFGEPYPAVFTDGAVNGVPALAFISQPAPLTVDQGDNASFSVVVNTVQTYQWQESTDGGAGWNDLSDAGSYSGTQTATLLISNTTTGMDGYQYRCNITAACSQSGTSDAATLTVNAGCPFPIAFDVSGGGDICPGGQADVSLSGSEAGVTYTLLFEGISTGLSLAGTGNPITFTGLQDAGTYTVEGTNICGTTPMNGQAVISLLPLPAVFTVSAGGEYCTGGSGIEITLSGSETGTNYDLILGGSTTIATLGGTGNLLSFGFITDPGTYTITGTNVCGTVGMDGSSIISILPLPQAFNVTGGGSFCQGGAGIPVGLDGSENGINYELYLDLAATDIQVTGDGSPIGFGFQTNPGSYTVMATNTCGSVQMNGEAIVITEANPNVYTVGGGGEICPGSAGTTITLSGSDADVLYFIDVSGSFVESVQGTGSPLTLGPYNTPGTYTIFGENNALCGISMDGSADISLLSLPFVYSVTGGGTYCEGGAGIAIGLESSETGQNYELYLNDVATGQILTGDGNPLDFGLQTAAGTYTVVAAHICGNYTMDGNAVIALDPLPLVFDVTGGGSYCAGGIGLAVGLFDSETNATYELYLDGIATGQILAGSGIALDFGLQTLAGTYTVVATNPCGDQLMNGSVSINILNLPNIYTVTGGGINCAGNPPSVGLDNSDAGIDYNLYLDGVWQTSTPGVGGVLDLGTHDAIGIYTVVAIDLINGCQADMTGNAEVTGYTVLSFTAQPADVTVLEGDNAVFSATINTGNYQWQVSTDGGSTFADLTEDATYSGVNTANLTVSNVSVAMDANQYRVLATEVTCNQSLFSDAALLTVNVPLVVITTAPSIDDAIGGNQVVVPVMVENLVNVAAISLVLTYTPGIVTYTGYQNLHPSLSAGFSLVNGAFPDRVKMGWFDITPVSILNGTLIEYLFTFNNGYTALHWNVETPGDCQYSDINANILNATFVDGHITGVCYLPEQFNVTGGGNYCVGGTGVTVGLDGSQTTATYELYLDGNPTAIVQNGTGAALDFGLQTTAGVYTVVASNNCGNADMLGNAVIGIDPLPALFNVTGGGNFCEGGAGMPVGLDGSENGVNYELYFEGSATGLILPGDGNAIDFGLHITAGSYTVAATNPCGTVSMNGNAVIIVDPLPQVFSVTGGGTYCEGGAGLAVGLEGSENGTDYQLYYNGTGTGIILAGTGAALDFGLQTAAGVYTVAATNPCAVINMDGFANITVDPLPLLFAVTGGGNYCEGSAGVNVGLSGSETTATYELYLDGTGSGIVLAGDGNPLDFGLQILPGNYTVVATNPCGNLLMTNSADVVINPLPTVYNLVGGGINCIGNLPSVSLDQSDVDIYYRLYLDGTEVIAWWGTGSVLDFGQISAEGTYTATAFNLTSGCQSDMNGTAVVTGYTVLSFSVHPTDVTIIEGDDAVFNAMNNTGNYQWQVSTDGGSTFTDLAETAPYSGVTTSQLTIAAAPASMSGNIYRVMAYEAVCNQTVYSNNATLVVNVPVFILTTAPSIDDAVVGNNVIVPVTVENIAGVAAISLVLNYTQGVLTYQGYQNLHPSLGSGFILVNGNFPDKIKMGWFDVTPISIASGTLVEFIFTFNSGYAVLHWNVEEPGDCQYSDLDANILNATFIDGYVTGGCDLPLVYNLTGGGSYCAGLSGLAVGLDGSENGVTYELILDGFTTGITLTGDGNPLDFGLQTTAGAYSVDATNICGTVSMNGSAVITVDPLPVVEAVVTGPDGSTTPMSSGNSYTMTICSGEEVITSDPTSTSLDPASCGPLWAELTYTTDISTLPPSLTVNVPVADTIPPFSSITPENHDGVAKDIVMVSTPYYDVNGNQILDAGDVAGAAVTFTLTVLPTPVVFSVTGGGSYCAGGAGLAVGLDGSENGVNYELFIDGTSSGIILGGDGNALAFGLWLQAGTYTITATNACGTYNMDGNAVITIDPLPMIQADVTGPDGSITTMTSGNSYTMTICSGEEVITSDPTSTSLDPASCGPLWAELTYTTNISTLPPTQTVNVAVASTIPPFTAITPENHDGVAKDIVFVSTPYYDVNGNSMLDAADFAGAPVNFTLSVLPTPVVFNVTGGGNYCAGGAGLAVGLDGSENGTNYELYLDGTGTGNILAGDGNALGFGLQTLAGTYTVMATNACATLSMDGNAVIGIDPLPLVFNVTGGGNYCAGGAGLAVGLDGSENGSNYELYLDGTGTGNILAGDGNALDFGLQTLAGTYTVMATNACATLSMDGNAVIGIDPLPLVFNVTGGGNYCAGGAGLAVGLDGSENGSNYELYLDGTGTGNILAGDGNALDFGLQTLAGTYTVMATNAC
ncbi:MAG TPA: hypothetical protein P5531_12980, partial [Bacteroidales bacterium]|nr:hypothetical protein [Bacteroidales bacterium]